MIRLYKNSEIRHNGEDFIYDNIARDYAIFIIADGRSGTKGFDASRYACTTLGEKLANHLSKKTKEPLEEKKQNIKRLIAANLVEINDYLCKERAGTTLDFILLQDNTGYYGHIGDSRIYFYRRDGTLQQATTDENNAEENIAGNRCKREDIEAECYQDSGPSRYLGGGKTLNFKPEKRAGDETISKEKDIQETEKEIKEFHLEEVSLIFATTDGLLKRVVNEEIKEILSAGRPEEVISSMCDLAYSPKQKLYLTLERNSSVFLPIEKYLKENFSSEKIGLDGMLTQQQNALKIIEFLQKNEEARKAAGEIYKKVIKEDDTTFLLIDLTASRQENGLEELRKRNSGLESKVAELNILLLNKTRELASKDKSTQELRDSYSDKEREERKRTEDEIRRITGERDGAKKNLEKLCRDHASLQEEKNTKERRVNELEREKTEYERKNAELSDRLQAANKLKDTVTTSLTALSSNFAEKEEEIRLLRAKEEEHRAFGENHNNCVSYQQVEIIKQEKNLLEISKKELLKNNKELTEKLAKTTKENEELKKESDGSSSYLEGIAKGIENISLERKKRERKVWSS